MTPFAPSVVNNANILKSYTYGSFLTSNSDPFFISKLPLFEFMNSMKFDQLNLSYDIFTPVSIICIGHQHAHDTEHNYTLSGAARFTPAHAVAGCKGRQLLCG